MKKRLIVLCLSVALMGTALPLEASAATDVSEAIMQESSCQWGSIEVVPLTDEDFEADDESEYVSEEELRELTSYTTFSVAASAQNVNEYYGNQLTGEAARLYESLGDVTAEKNGITVTYKLNGMSIAEWRNIHDEELSDAMISYLYDHPEKLYFNTANGIRYGYRSDGRRITVNAAFMVSDYYTTALEDEAEAVVDRVLADVPDTTEYEELKDLHDWLVLNSQYDSEALTAEEGSEKMYYAHGPLGCLLKQTGVCESYAKTFKILCARLNIPCVLVTSDTHMWNYVQMENGNWYMIDCTWDDPVGAREGYIGYTYFLVSNSPNIDTTHTEDDYRPYPSTSVSNYQIATGDTDDPYHIEAAAVKENEQDATCEEQGSYDKVVYCSICNTELSRTQIIVAATGHTVVTDEAVEATCTKEGKTKGSHCEVCGTVIEAQETVAATGHTVVTDEAVEATCTEEGKTKGSHCAVCGTVIEKQETIPATGYTEVTDEAVEATCTEEEKTEDTSTILYYPKTITLARTSMTYTGKSQKPAVTVKDSNGKIISRSNYTLSYKNNKNVGVATVTIEFKGNYKGTKTLKYTIVPKGTTLTTTAKSKAITVHWKKQTSQITGYKIQYATNSKFTDAKTVTVKNTKTTGTTLRKLKGKKTYYVRICTYKTVKVNGKSQTIYSAWSEVKNVKTKK